MFTDRDRSGVLPRACDTIVGVQLGEGVIVARDRRVLATISDRRRNAAVRAMHAERLQAAKRYLRCIHEGVHIIRLWQPAVAAAVILARTLGLYAEVMTVTLHLDDAVAEALAAEAARRG